MTESSGMGSGPDLDLRLLRYFIAVAEELHFTRAAARLFVAQQALSRDIRALERRLGTPLFVRTTRRVTLTSAGERLLARARALMELHDLMLREMHEPTRPAVVDLVYEGRLTAARILEHARALAPGTEFRGRYGGGMGAALGGLIRGELDVAVGRAEWRDQQMPAGLRRRLVRLEPLALLVPRTHPLAAEDPISMRLLEGVEIDANSDGWVAVGATSVPVRVHAPEWFDFAHQFLAMSRARPTPPHASTVGLEEQAQHLTHQGLPILICADHVAVPGGVVRPLVDPVPLFPWSLVRSTDVDTPGAAALEDAAIDLSKRGNWLEAPRSGWLPEPESTRLAMQISDVS